MFCTRCGAELQPNVESCPQCRRPIGDLVGDIARSRLEGHLHILAVLWMVVGALFLIPAILILIFGGGIHLVLQGHEPAASFLPFLIYLAGSTLLILGTGGICVGLGLRQCQPWARIAAIILGVLALFHPPIGTALGIYTLWVLLSDEDGDAYHYLSHPA